MKGELSIDHFITRTWLLFCSIGLAADCLLLVNQLTLNSRFVAAKHSTDNFKGVAATNDAIDALHGGDCLRAVVEY